jgi:hypothetical protein
MLVLHATSTYQVIHLIFLVWALELEQVVPFTSSRS